MVGKILRRGDMKVLTDKQIFGDPYREEPQPPPYENWELQGHHSKSYPAPETRRPSEKRMNYPRRLGI